MRKALFIVLATAAGCAFAQQYRWIDDKGRVQYTDTPPPTSAKGVQKKNLAPPGKPNEGTVPFVLQLALKNNPVKLYTIPNCDIGCNEARKYLNERGVPFTEITVNDQKRYVELKNLSGSTEVPVVQVGSRVHKGYDPAAYEGILDDAGYPRTGVLPARNQPAPPEAPPATAPAVAPPAAKSK